MSELADRYGPDKVAGTACDVSKAGDVKNLVQEAQAALGDIDLWINNAGSNAYSFKPLVEAAESDLVDIVQTNVLGVMICCQVSPSTTDLAACQSPFQDSSAVERSRTCSRWQL